MKIAFFHELPYGGAWRVVIEYGKILSKNHTVDLFYVDETEDPKSKEVFKKTFFFPQIQKKHRLYNDTLSLFRLSVMHKKIAEMIDMNGYDFVFVHPSKFTQAPFLLRYLKTKSVYFCQEPLRIVHDLFLKQLPKTSPTKKIYESLNRSMRKAIDILNMKKAGIILTNSKYSANWIKNAYEKKAAVCYLGVDDAIFVYRKSQKLNDILFLGQPIDIEGYNLLEGALTFFDKKPIVRVVSRDTQGFGIEDLELVNAYNQSKVVVCLSRNEPFGLTALEAMSCQVPVIAVNEGGYKESVLQEITGFLVERKKKALYEKLKLLLNDERLRNQMGKEARKQILLHWTWEKSVKRFLKIVNEE